MSFLRLICIVLMLMGCLNSQGVKMKETYEVTTLSGEKVKFDKETDLMIPDREAIAAEEYSKALLQVQSILSSSPFSSYTPDYLDPNNPRDKEQYKGWRELYLKEPAKGIIAPWTKKEKAYYLSLKTKKERVIYLIKRSGLRSAMIDIPLEAIGEARAFPEITEKVEANKGTLKSRLHSGEWNLSAGLLGNIEALGDGTEVGVLGFKARARQILFLWRQITGKIKNLSLSYRLNGFIRGTTYERRPLKASLLEPLVKNPPLDEFGMLPFLDELIGVDWVMDFNKFPYAFDAFGSLTRRLNKKLEAGELLDPRDSKATKESREEFRKYMIKELDWEKQEYSHYGFSKDRSKQSIELYIDSMILEAKIMATTPPQGYIYAPYYYFPEELDELFYAGKLDRKLDPRIPAMDRAGFPKDLREKILEYANKHKIKD